MDIDRTALFWFLLSVSVPPILLMAFSALPALFASFFTIIWPEEDPYSLKTACLLGFLSFICSCALVVYIATNQNADAQVTHRISLVLFAVLLTIEWFLSLMALRIERTKRIADKSSFPS